MKQDLEIKEMCRKLEPIIGKRAKKLWYMYLSEDFRGRQNLSIEIGLVAERLLNSGGLAQDKILLTPPSSRNCQGDFLIGNILYNNQEVEQLFLRKEDFIKQVGIFATTGEGKTNLAYLMAIQLLRNKTPFIVIDWKRSWRNLLSLKDEFPELEDVHILTIGKNTAPFSWNPFRAPPGTDQEQWISNVCSSLERSHLSGPGVYHHFLNVYISLLKGLPEGFYPNFYDGLKILKHRQSSNRELAWKQSAMRILQSFTIGEASISFNARYPLKLESLLDKPVIFELDLEIPEDLRAFFSEIILRWIHLYRLTQNETDSLRHVLFLEEAHNIFRKRFSSQDLNALESVYREIRAFGQGLVTITQHPSSLPLYVLGNCHTQIYLGLMHEDDIRAARKSLFLDYKDDSYFASLKVGECIAKIKNRINPCLVRIPLVPVKKGKITDSWIKKNVKSYLPLIYDGTAPQNDTYLPRDIYSLNNPETAKHRYYVLLVDIYINPLRPVTERYERLSLNIKTGNEYRKILEAEGYIETKDIYHSKGKLTLFEITTKGKLILRDLGYAVPTTLNESIEHKFWKEKIADHFKNRNHQVFIEEKIIGGNADIVVIDGEKKTCIEIETGKSDVIGNIQKSLSNNFDEIISVSTNKIIQERIKSQVEKEQITDDRLKIASVFDYDVF